MVSLNTDGMSEDEKEAFFAEASKRTDIPLFEGRVQHAYDVACVADPTRCPRCGGDTQTKYANFIYATQIAVRVMFVPAGRFCTRCPSVVIDQQLIECGVSDPRFRYQGVLGIDYGKKKEPDHFRTWNGKDAVYVFDEDQNLLGINTFSPGLPGRIAPPAPAQSAKKNRRKRKRLERMAKRSRKTNRKK